MKKRLLTSVRVILSSIILLLIVITACNSNLPLNTLEAKITHAPAVGADQVVTANATASDILNRSQVPVLCYHQIRDWGPSDSKRAKDYIVPVNNFREQIRFF